MTVLSTTRTDAKIVIKRAPQHKQKLPRTVKELPDDQVVERHVQNGERWRRKDVEVKTTQAKTSQAKEPPLQEAIQRKLAGAKTTMAEEQRPAENSENQKTAPTRPPGQASPWPP